jgi:hypothetical protein
MPKPMTSVPMRKAAAVARRKAVVAKATFFGSPMITSHGVRRAVVNAVSRSSLREWDQVPTSLPSFSAKCFARCRQVLTSRPIHCALSTLRAMTIPFWLTTETTAPAGSC